MRRNPLRDIALATSSAMVGNAMTLSYLKAATLLLVAFALPLSAGAADSLADDARNALARATVAMRAIATEGGYLWRYSPDLSERAGENPATATQIWVQTPGTPAMGLAFLRAYGATGDTTYLEAAKDAADALVAGQLVSGGWDYLIEFDPAKRQAWYLRSDVGRISDAEAAQRRNVSTYDDDNTQEALRFLVALTTTAPLGDAPRDRRHREARDYGLAKLLEAQRPNGGWPQRWSGQRIDPASYPVRPARFPATWPREHPKTPYYDHYTLNDDTQRDCILTLLDAARRLNRTDYREAALRGGAFLLQAQLPEPQPGWAQQYNAQMEPAWARAFEPPGISSRESTGVMRLLVDLYLETGDNRFLEPLPRAIAWLRRSEIAPGQWARLYELGTNRPIFGDRDGKIYYAVEELSAERQTGYAWKGAFGVPQAIAYHDSVVADGREATLARRATTPASATAGPQGRPLAANVREAIDALDAEDRWIVTLRGSRVISTGAFISNVNLLSAYLEARQGTR